MSGLGAVPNPRVSYCVHLLSLNFVSAKSGEEGEDSRARRVPIEREAADVEGDERTLKGVFRSVKVPEAGC